MINFKVTKKEREELVASGEDLPATQATALKRLTSMFSTLELFFVDRSTELEQIKLALLTKEHVLLKGAPGTAKSLLARSVFQNIIGSSNYAVQFSKFMSEDYVFGPVNIRKLREDGEIVHNTKGTIVDSDFAFIDEFFDGSDVLLRSMLEVLNERTFTRNAKSLSCPLHTAILTSNFSRTEEETEAILDRILFKSDVQPISDADGRMSMYKSALDKNSTKKIAAIKMADLNVLTAFVKTGVSISEEVLTTYDRVVRDYMRQAKINTVTDRTCVKMLSILKASAVLHGRSDVLPDDILSIKLSLCPSGDDLKEQAFESVYSRVVTEGKKEQDELVEVKKMQRKYEKICSTSQVNDKRKDSILKIADLQKFLETDLRNITGITTQNVKDEVEKLGNKVDASIAAFKENINI